MKKLSQNVQKQNTKTVSAAGSTKAPIKKASMVDVEKKAVKTKTVKSKVTGDTLKIEIPKIKKTAKPKISLKASKSAKQEKPHQTQHENNHHVHDAKHYTKEYFKMDKEFFLINQRKTAEAIADVSRMATDVVKAMSSLQSQFMRQSMDDFGMMMKEFTAAPMSTETYRNQASRMKDSMHKAMDHSAQMSNIVVKSNSDLYDKFQNHFSDAFEELKYNAVGKKKV